MQGPFRLALPALSSPAFGLQSGFRMNWQKIFFATLFFIMAVGGTGGLMLVGYTPILHSR